MALAGRPVLALVPARGGSKGVPRKNLRLLAGRPLVVWSLLAARQAAAVDAVYLSSDDAEILAQAAPVGAIPLPRPADAASDTASAVAVVEHFIAALPAPLREQDPYLVYLQPTSPCRSARHIDAALAAMAEAGTHTLLSVVETEKSPYKSFGLDQQGRIKSLFDERLSNARRQDLPRTFFPNGAIYVFRLSDFAERGGFPSNGSLPFVMSAADSIDIDTEADLLLAARHLEQTHG
jgi:CMP-N-acetylneuraminic acid synthetase